MSRNTFRSSIAFVVFALMFFASSAVPANTAASKGDVSTTLNVMTPVTLGGTSIAPAHAP